MSNFMFRRPAQNGAGVAGPASNPKDQAELYTSRALNEDLVKIARDELIQRQARAKFLPKCLLGEPAWDMLLDLYVSGASHQDVRTSSLCIAANVPQTTGLRYIDILEAEGMISRRKCSTDHRVTLVILTDIGSEKIERCLEERMFHAQI